jgi:3',5'-cyclic AMP phosphodiesterase CpdA
MRPLKKISHYLILICLLIINTSFAQFSFVHLTDLHVSDGDSYVNNSDINGVVFSQMLATIRHLEPKPAFVVVSGDVSNIGNGLNNGMYSVLTQFLFPSPISNPGNGAYFIDSALQTPIYFVPGNHDYYLLLTPPLSNSTIDNYTSQLAPDLDYVIHYQNAAICMMRSGSESFRPVWIDNNITTSEASGIDNSQLNWLQNELTANAGMKKIVVMHHPLVNALGTNADGTPSTGTVLDPADGSILNNRDALLNLCENNQVDITLSGHVHQNVVAARDGSVVDENWTGGTRYIQTGACEYGNYRIITVDSNFVTVDDAQQLDPSGMHTYTQAGANNFNAFYNASQKHIVVDIRNIPIGDASTISLLNINGSVLMTLSTASGRENLITFDADCFSAGLYIIRISGTSGIMTRKIAIY